MDFEKTFNKYMEIRFVCLECNSFDTTDRKKAEKHIQEKIERQKGINKT